MSYIAYLMFLAWWLAGIALAKGFWLTLLACFFPLYSMYLVVERLVQCIAR